MSQKNFSVRLARAFLHILSVTLLIGIVLVLFRVSVRLPVKDNEATFFSAFAAPDGPEVVFQGTLWDAGWRNPSFSLIETVIASRNKNNETTVKRYVQPQLSWDIFVAPAPRPSEEEANGHPTPIHKRA